MLRRDLSVFVLKLSELKDYEQVKQERQAAKINNESGTGDGSSTSSAAKACPLATKVGPKSKQEILERIGLKQ